MHDGSVHEADRNDPRRDELVRSVERAADETFLLAVGPVRDERPDVARGGHPLFAETVGPPAEFERGGHGASLGFAHAAYPPENGEVGDGSGDVQETKHLVGQGLHAFPVHSRADERGYELAV
ncbi:MAG TPA: hypothetical protein VMV90_00230 [Rectinemataceae bacterium]|nr:hypothetical protein [Rectinemataceae bacterium]